MVFRKTKINASWPYTTFLTIFIARIRGLKEHQDVLDDDFRRALFSTNQRRMFCGKVVGITSQAGSKQKFFS